MSRYVLAGRTRNYAKAQQSRNGSFYTLFIGRYEPEIHQAVQLLWHNFFQPSSNAIAKVSIAGCVLIGVIFGAISEFGLLEWITVIAYPHNVGGPVNSWPTYKSMTFECIILLSALTVMISIFAMNGLPEPYKPLFSLPAFERASVGKFFPCIESSDPKFKWDDTVELLPMFGRKW